MTFQSSYDLANLGLCLGLLREQIKFHWQIHIRLSIEDHCP